MRSWLIVPFALCVLAPRSGRAQDAARPDGAVPDLVAGITARELGAHMRFLASDLMRGRDTASEEIRIASEYLATRLEAAGAEPAGDRGTFFQSFPLEIITPDAGATRLEVILERGGSRSVIAAELGADYGLSTRGLSPVEIEADVVFAGYGLVDEAAGVDDYDGLEVEDRFVLVLSGAPRQEDSEGQGGRRGGRSASSSAKAEAARERGALGLLMVNAPGEESRSFLSTEDLQRSFGRPSLGLPRDESAMTRITLNDSLRDRLLPPGVLSADTIRPGELDGVRVRFRFAADRERIEDRNVVGFFPGSDPDRAREVVIYSAHYDHVGVGDDGEIYNGSDDNASGTSALLEIAEAFSEGPRPARSVAFLWVSGEEKGLLGSAWFADHVSLPEGHTIVADINLDMVSRNDGKQVGVTPSPEHEDYNSLVPAARVAAEAEGLEVQFNIDSFYHRTDSYNFARKGIPALFFFSGTHDDYHRPTDDVEKADFDKAARIARAAYRLGWQVAEAEEVPAKIQAEDRDFARTDSPRGDGDTDNGPATDVGDSR